MSETEAGGETGTEGPAREPERACERCGSFAVLTSNGFRAWCEPCWAGHSHPLDDPGRTAGQLLATLVRLLVEHWPLAVGLVALRTIPMVALTWLTTLPGWFNSAWTWTLGSLPEAIIVAVVVARSLGSRRALRPQVVEGVRRLPATVGTNLLTGIPVMLGSMLLCLPGFLIGGLLMAAVPLTVIEKLPPHRAFTESWRRSRPLLGALFAVTALLFVLASVPSLVEGAIIGFGLVTSRPIDAPTRHVISTASGLFGGLLSVPGILFQVVAWSATRPWGQKSAVAAKPGSP